MVAASWGLVTEGINVTEPAGIVYVVLLELSFNLV